MANKLKIARSHLKIGHKWSVSTFVGKIVGFGWTCSKNMHCISNHSEKDHPSIGNVHYELVETTGEGLDQEGQHSISCFLDLMWHTSCIEKTERKR